MLTICVSFFILPNGKCKPITTSYSITASVHVRKAQHRTKCERGALKTCPKEHVNQYMTMIEKALSYYLHCLWVKVVRTLNHLGGHIAAVSTLHTASSY